jgi:azurin
MSRVPVLRAALLLALVLVIPIGAKAAGKQCKLQITADDLMRYDRSELQVGSDCAAVQLTLRHAGRLPKEAMGHNWVLVRASDLDAVANAGMSAGLQNNYVAPDDKRVIAATRLTGGGESAQVTFATTKLEKGQAYAYLCTFPGHNTMMRGVLKFG